MYLHQFRQGGPGALQTLDGGTGMKEILRSVIVLRALPFWLEKLRVA